MNMVWEDISNNDFLRSASSNENRIDVIWIGQLIGDIKSRKCVLHSVTDWRAISMNDSFVPRYKDGKSPCDLDAEILTLEKYYSNATIDERQKGKQAVNNSSSVLQITTSYDTASNSRLIVDGLKRSLCILHRINIG